MPTYTKEEKKTIKALKEAGAVLSGEETSEEIANLAAAQKIVDDEANEEEVGERATIEGVPEKLPAQLEEDGKGKKFPVFFTASFKGLSYVYGPNGVRHSAGLDPKYAARACASFNILERQKHRVIEK